MTDSPTAHEHCHTLKQSPNRDHLPELYGANEATANHSKGSLIERWDRKVQAQAREQPLCAASTISGSADEQKFSSPIAILPPADPSDLPSNSALGTARESSAECLTKTAPPELATKSAAAELKKQARHRSRPKISPSDTKTRIAPALDESTAPAKTPSSRKRKTPREPGRKAERVTSAVKSRAVFALVAIGALALGLSAFFDRSIEDAKTAAANTSTEVVRAAIARYQADHGVLPGVLASAGGICVADAVPGSGPAGSTQAFLEQLTRFTNESGQACSLPGVAFVHGPYLKSATLPEEPFSLSNSLTILGGADAVEGAQQPSPGGWIYNLDTGQFAPSRQVKPD